MIEKNTVIIDLKDYNKLIEESIYLKTKELYAKSLEKEIERLKKEMLFDSLITMKAYVDVIDSEYKWTYDFEKNMFEEKCLKFGINDEVKKEALDQYIEYNRGE